MRLPFGPRALAALAALHLAGCCLSLDYACEGPARVVGRSGPEHATPVRVPPPHAESAPSGAPTAPSGHVMIEVFMDFQCPYCRRLMPTLDALRQELGGRLSVVIRQNPLAFHDKARPAATAALAAGRQGKLYEMSALLLASPRNLAPEQFPRLARQLRLDVARFERDLEDPALQAQIDADQQLAQARGARGTPTMFINGQKVVGARPLSALRPIVQRALEQPAPGR